MVFRNKIGLKMSGNLPRFWSKHHRITWRGEGEILSRFPFWFALLSFRYVISLSFNCEKSNVMPPRLQGTVLLRLKEELPSLGRCVIIFSSLTPSFSSLSPEVNGKLCLSLQLWTKRPTWSQVVISPTQGKSYDFRQPKKSYLFCCCIVSLPMSPYLSAVLLGN